MLEEWWRKAGDDIQLNRSLLNNNRIKYLLAIIIAAGLLALIWPTTKVTPDNSSNENLPINTIATTSVKDSMTNELEAILTQIDGAGQVQVSINLASAGIKIYANNSRDEKRDIQEIDNKNVKKTTTELSSTQDLAISSGSPLLVEEKGPEILGVLVVAEGAHNLIIAEKLTKATATLLNIPVHKVTVMPRKGVR